MKITTVSAADQPLTKNLKTGTGYPLVSNVSSFEFSGNGLKWLHAMLNVAAGHGQALLTGALDKPLKNESRAGHSVSVDTEVLILDVDHDNLHYKTRNDLLDDLGLQGDYIFQYSSRAADINSLRGHYFLLLDKPCNPTKLKAFIKYLNFSCLREYLTLAPSQMALKWPLDVVVNDPGRLVYIAPPICDYDPIPDRIILVERGQERHHLPDLLPNLDVIAEVNRLREGRALPKRAQDSEIVTVDPAEVKVTGVKEERGYVYLNLNGGDSWGYYFDPENPTLVMNFKDEPRFRLKDLDPSLFDKYHQPLPVSHTNLSLHNGAIRKLEPLVFREPLDDIYYQVLYDPDSNEVVQYATTNQRSRLNDFMLTNGGQKPGVIFDGKVEFNPSNPVQIDPTARYLNTFAPTRWMNVTNTRNEPPKRIGMIIDHITVDQETKDHFLNWLAYIYQYRKKTGTAWLFHGTSGTGKGTLFHAVLKPIFGEYSSICLLEQMADTFNGHMQKNLLLFIDEFNLDDLNNNSGRVWNKLKSLITEPIMAIRGMRRDQRQYPSFTNVIMSSNNAVPIRIDDAERRINIAPRQITPKQEILEWYDEIELELEAFCEFLRGYPVDALKARKILDNDARKQMINDGRTSHEEFFHAIRHGDLEFFLDFVNTGGYPAGGLVNYEGYEQIMDRWMKESRKPGPHFVQREDLLFVYNYITGQSRAISMLKFAAICKNNGVQFNAHRVGSRPRTYRTEVEWVPLETDVKLRLVAGS